ncbi:enolase C-terminal domain-like protein [Kribbella turkmenica]|nr:enolase C-terminal domain-like protein [Kribbella turkmenica]
MHLCNRLLKGGQRRAANRARGTASGKRLQRLPDLAQLKQVAYGVALAPHCPLGPIALAASLQVDLAAPKFLIQEQSLGIRYNANSDLLDYLVGPRRLQVR